MSLYHGINSQVYSFFFRSHFFYVRDDVREQWKVMRERQMQKKEVDKENDEEKRRSRKKNEKKGEKKTTRNKKLLETDGI